MFSVGTEKFCCLSLLKQSSYSTVTPVLFEARAFSWICLDNISHWIFKKQNHIHALIKWQREKEKTAKGGHNISDLS